MNTDLGAKGMDLNGRERGGTRRLLKNDLEGLRDGF